MKKNNLFNIVILSCVIMLVVFVTGCSSNPAPQTNTVTTQNGASASTPTQTSGSNPASSGVVKDITITATNYEFRQEGSAINKGDTVRLTLVVEQGTHSIVLSGYNVEITPTPAGKSQSVTFVADKSGTFNYHCNNYCGSGHKDMVGTIVVN